MGRCEINEGNFVMNLFCDWLRFPIVSTVVHQYVERPHPSLLMRPWGQKIEEISKIYQKEGGECYYSVYMWTKIMCLICVDDVPLVPVLRIRDVYPGFRIRSFSIPVPGSRFKKIPDPWSASKNLSIFNLMNCFYALVNMIREEHPGSGYWFFTYPGSQIQGS